MHCKPTLNCSGDGEETGAGCGWVSPLRRTAVLQSNWTLDLSGVSSRDSRRAGVGIFTSHLSESQSDPCWEKQHRPAPNWSPARPVWCWFMLLFSAGIYDSLKYRIVVLLKKINPETYFVFRTAAHTLKVYVGKFKTFICALLEIYYLQKCILIKNLYQDSDRFLSNKVCHSKLQQYFPQRLIQII